MSGSQINFERLNQLCKFVISIDFRLKLLITTDTEQFQSINSLRAEGKSVISQLQTLPDNQTILLYTCDLFRQE